MAMTRSAAALLMAALLAQCALAQVTSSTVFNFSPALTPWANGGKAFGSNGNPITNTNAM